jgi:glycosyltransferase involved in cell wall biosynthesis
MDFLFFSPIGWDNMDGAHRPVRFAMELAQRGHRVLYIQLEKSRVKPRTETLRVYDLAELGLGERRVLAAYYGLDYGASDDARAALGNLLDTWKTHGEAQVAIYSAPFRPFLEFLPMLRTRGYRLVFDVLDDYAAMRAFGYFCYDPAAEQFLAQNCDLALPLSPALAHKVQAYGAQHTCLLKDGVDLELFREAPVTPVPIARGELTLGFWGWIWAYNVDVPLLAHLAHVRPTWQLHLIGPYEERVAQLLHFPNVQFHGQVARARLRAYAAQFDVCLLPLPNDAFNRARDPLKVYEYLACGKPVVATDQPQLAGMPGVYLSCSDAEFVAQVERAAGERVDPVQLQRFLEEQTWARRVDELLHAVESTPPAPRALAESPRGAMPGAETELERWRAYAQHLEKMVDDHDAHARELERALEQTGWRYKLTRALGRKHVT